MKKLMFAVIGALALSSVVGADEPLTTYTHTKANAPSKAEYVRDSNVREIATKIAQQYAGSGITTNNVRDIANEEIDKRELGVNGADHPLPEYLHYAKFDDVYADDAKWYYGQVDHGGLSASLQKRAKKNHVNIGMFNSPIGLCSARRLDNIVERDYDWYYNDTPTFVVEVSGIAGIRYASIGVAEIGTNLTEKTIASEKGSKYWRCLPGCMLDGINEKGVMAEMNVVPTNGSEWETKGDRDINGHGGIRWILDNAMSAGYAASNIAERAYIPDALKNLGFSLHFMICDKDETWIVEDGVPYLCDEETPVMTNYRLYMPEGEEDLFGSGYARAEILKNRANPITDVWYTKGFAKTEEGIAWPDELAGTEVDGRKLTKNDRDELQKFARDNIWYYLPPKRNVVNPETGKIVWWQTIHCSRYDIDKKSFQIAVQENPVWYTFALSAATDEDEVKRLANAEIDKRDFPKQIEDAKSSIREEFKKIPVTSITNKNGMTFLDLKDADRSDFGITWTKTNYKRLDSYCYGNGVFVGSRWDGSSTRVWYSTDGITWTQSDSLAPVHGTIYGNGHFFAQGGGAIGGVYRSDDGITWTKLNNSPNENDLALCHNGNRLVLSCEGSIWYSDDNGDSWTKGYANDLDASSIAYGNNRFVAVSAPVWGNKGAWYSDDGITWTKTSDLLDTDYICYGGGKFVSYHGNHTWVSDDGITWTRVDKSISRACYGNDKFIATSMYKVWYSHDGVSWVETDTPHDMGSHNPPEELVYGNGRIVLSGSNGGVWYGNTKHIPIIQSVTVNGEKLSLDENNNANIGNVVLRDSENSISSDFALKCGGNRVLRQSDDDWNFSGIAAKATELKSLNNTEYGWRVWWDRTINRLVNTWSGTLVQSGSDTNATMRDIEDLKADMKKIFKIKGSKPTVADLPPITTPEPDTPKEGDLWFIEEQVEGKNVFYFLSDANVWTRGGATIDMSAYKTGDQIDAEMILKRDKVDTASYRPKNRVWTWTSDNAPSDFLKIANEVCKIEPVFRESSNAWWLYDQVYDIDGKMKYSLHEETVLPDTASVVSFKFDILDEFGEPTGDMFTATATRDSDVEDTTVTPLTGSETGLATEAQLRSRVSFKTLVEYYKKAYDAVAAYIQTFVDNDKGVGTLNFKAPGTVGAEAAGLSTFYINGKTMKELVGEVGKLPVDESKLDPKVTFWKNGSYQNAAIEIGYNAKAALNPEYIKGLHPAENVNLRSTAIAIGAYASATNPANANSSQAIALGPWTTAEGSQAIAIGAGARHLDGTETNLTGDNTYAKGSLAMAVGYGVKAIGDSSTALGSSSNGAGSDNTKRTIASGKEATAIGYRARAVAEGATAIGHDTQAEGVKSFTLGDGAKTTAAASGAIQIGTGVNNEANTLKFQNVTIVRDGHVVGATLPEPETVDPEGTDEVIEITVNPFSMTTILPTHRDLIPGTEIGMSCTGLRNYTVYMPNEPEVRAGLPAMFATELPDGVKAVIIGSSDIIKLPCRIVAQQPYNKLATFELVQIDDGSEWNPSIGECNLVYKMSGNKLCTTNGVSKSILGECLHCPTNVVIKYINQDGNPRQVPIIEKKSGEAYVKSNVFYGYVGSLDVVVQNDDCVPKMYDIGEDTFADIEIRYQSIFGETSKSFRIPVVE